MLSLYFNYLQVQVHSTAVNSRPALSILIDDMSHRYIPITTCLRVFMGFHLNSFSFPRFFDLFRRCNYAFLTINYNIIIRKSILLIFDFCSKMKLFHFSNIFLPWNMQSDKVFLNGLSISLNDMIVRLRLLIQQKKQNRKNL